MIFLVLILSTLMACSSSKDTAVANESTEVRGERGPRKGGKPDIDKMFAEMDANDDGRLAKIEAKGRLVEDFDRIDADGDGYVTKEEMQNAPRPTRGRGGSRNN